MTAKTLSSLTLSLLLVGCGASSSNGDGGQGEVDLAAMSVDDGPTMRVACTNAFGSALSGTYGRLDGYLVAIVPPGQSGCSSDSSHVHLQVKANGAVYDIAVNVRDDSGGAVEYRAVDFKAVGGVWAEGWHPGTGFDYAGLGLHSDTFVATQKDPLVASITSELANANHVSIWGSTYPDGSGAHLIHRNNGYDGGIVIRPLSATSRLLAFHFSDQTF